jgi:predicted nucleotidyltransferase
VGQLHPIVAAFLARADTALAPGYSAVLHGSMVRGDFLAQRSDLNLLVVADRVGSAELRALAPEFGLFERDQMSPPLLIPRAEWQRAADVFPIEITDLRSSYQVLRGEDPLNGLEVRPGDLQRALESELRGKLLRLRIDYGLYHADQEKLAMVVGHSIGALRVLFRTIVALAGRAVPATDSELAGATTALIGGDSVVLERLFERRRNPSWRCPPHLFESYLGIVEHATRFVDHYLAGDH